jgi:hypothetical protein
MHQAINSRMIGNGVGAGAHISVAALRDNYQPTHLINTIQNKRIVQQTGPVKKDYGIGSSRTLLPKPANTEPNGLESENNTKSDNLTFKDFTHGENYGEIIDLVGNDSESDESITTHKEVPADKILVQNGMNHNGVDKSNGNQNRTPLIETRRLPSHSRQPPVPSVVTSIEGGMDPADHDGSLIRRALPQGPRALAAAAVKESLKRARQAEASLLPESSGEEWQAKRLRVRHTNNW